MRPGFGRQRWLTPRRLSSGSVFGQSMPYGGKLEAYQDHGRCCQTLPYHCSSTQQTLSCASVGSLLWHAAPFHLSSTGTHAHRMIVFQVTDDPRLDGVKVSLIEMKELRPLVSAKRTPRWRLDNVIFAFVVDDNWHCRSLSSAPWSNISGEFMGENQKYVRLVTDDCPRPTVGRDDVSPTTAVGSEAAASSVSSTSISVARVC